MKKVGVFDPLKEALEEAAEYEREVVVPATKKSSGYGEHDLVTNKPVNDNYEELRTTEVAVGPPPGKPVHDDQVTREGAKSTGYPCLDTDKKYQDTVARMLRDRFKR
jgi:hypothetical protein